MYTNAQAMDSVALINAMNVAMAPAMSMGSLYMTMANSMGMAAMNHVYAQYQSHIGHQAAMVVGVSKMFQQI